MLWLLNRSVSVLRNKKNVNLVKLVLLRQVDFDQLLVCGQATKFDNSTNLHMMKMYFNPSC